MKETKWASNSLWIIVVRFCTFRRIKEYLTDVEERTKNQEEIKNKINEEKDKVYKYLVDNLISSTVNIIW